jgi:hypothetical protein
MITTPRWPRRRCFENWRCFANGSLRSDDVLLDALALSVLTSVQEAIDIAFHMATDEGWGIPAS